MTNKRAGNRINKSKMDFCEDKKQCVMSDNHKKFDYEFAVSSTITSTCFSQSSGSFLRGATD